MMASQPNAAQKRWREEVRELGLGQIIHHCTDRTMKIKGVGNIGHWFIVPCRDDAHHREIHSMGKDRKPYEKKRFAMVCDVYALNHGPAPLPEGVYEAIMEFTK